MKTAAAMWVDQESDFLNDSECFETFEDIKEQIEEVERQLADRFKIRRHIRRALIALDRANKLEEDELVARWHELYSNYADWTRSDTWDEPRPTIVNEESEERAAEAALAALWLIQDQGLAQLSDYANHGSSFQAGEIP